MAAGWRDAAAWLLEKLIFWLVLLWLALKS